MNYSSLDVAYAFLEHAQNDPDFRNDMSHMKLQKLVFFAQVVSVCLNLDNPLHQNNTHAWDYGPVSTLLYNKLKKLGRQYLTLNNPEVQKAFESHKKIEDQTAKLIIDQVWDSFKKYSPVQLSMISHRKNSPWEITYNRDRYGVIPLKLMASNKFGDPEPNGR